MISSTEKPKEIWAIPPGRCNGKTSKILLTALLKALQGDNVVIVYNTDSMASYGMGRLHDLYNALGIDYAVSKSAKNIIFPNSNIECINKQQYTSPEFTRRRYIHVLLDLNHD